VGFQLYKSSQGRYLRGGTGVAAALVDLVFCYYLWTLLSRYLAENAYKPYLEYGIPAAAFVVLGVAVFFYVNKRIVVDDLVATETEMKKVSWSNRAELVGSTAVVIATVFVLAVFIFEADGFFSGVLGPGIAVKWDEQGWVGRIMTALNFLLVDLVVCGSVAYAAKAKWPSVSQKSYVYGLTACVFVGILAAAVYLWLVGFHIPGLRLYG